MEDREEVVGVALHPRVARREHQPGDADREQQHERQKVLAELLERGRPALAHTAPHRQHHPDHYQDRRPDEAVEDQKSEDRVDGKGEGRKAEHVGAIPLEVVRERLEVHPPEDERERDRRRDHAAPHDQEVRAPPCPAPAEDESIERKVVRHMPRPRHEVASEMAGSQKRLPASPPVDGGRRPLEPHRVPVGDAEGREENRERVADECRVEVVEVP